MPIPHITYDTMNYPPERRFDVWREALSSVHDIYLAEIAPENFEASVEGWMIGDILVAHHKIPAIRYVRSKQKIRDENSDHYVFTCVLEGSVSGDFDGGVVASREGEIAVADVARPFDVIAKAGAYISVSVPRSVLERATCDPRSFHGCPITGALGRLTARHLTYVLDAAPNLHENEAGALSQTTVQLLASSLIAQSNEKPDRSTLSLFAARQDILGYIEDNFHRVELVPEQIFKELGLSRATAYRAFKDSGGIAKHIQHRRLIAARALLHHPQETRSIMEIASAVGFEDAPLFSRSYKRLFDETPRQTRDMALNRSPKMEAASKANFANFRRWMRDLEVHLTKDTTD
jgi:AraC-like DNA-binding protein